MLFRAACPISCPSSQGLDAAKATRHRLPRLRRPTLPLYLPSLSFSIFQVMLKFKQHRVGFLRQGQMAGLIGLVSFDKHKVRRHRVSYQVETCSCTIPQPGCSAPPQTRGLGSQRATLWGGGVRICKQGTHGTHDLVLPKNTRRAANIHFGGVPVWSRRLPLADGADL